MSAESTFAFLRPLPSHVIESHVVCHVLGSEDIVTQYSAVHKGLLSMIPTTSNEVPSAVSIEEELKAKLLKTTYFLFYREGIATGGSSAAGN